MTGAATVTTDEHTLEAHWHREALHPEKRSAWMAGAQAALVLIASGAKPDDLQREILLWARTHIGRTA